MKQLVFPTLWELDNILRESCERSPQNTRDKMLHMQIVKWHYKGSDIIIDYNRQRVMMNVVAERRFTEKYKSFQEKIIPLNLGYNNLYDFFKNLYYRRSEKYRVL